jgi:ABC-type branched-subunit amino acid transport system ATPase component
LTETTLEIKGITSGYGDSKVIFDLSMFLEKQEIACIIGPNGSGKSTLLKTIVGIVKPSKGKIMFNGMDITGLDPHEVLRKGICLLPQGRSAFPIMTVMENLQMGAYITEERIKIQERLKEVYGLFPILHERRKEIASKLSGGEIAMLCIARALMSQPKIMLLDEPSLGLAPKVTNEVYQQIVDINSNGTSVIIVEQNLSKVLSVAHNAHVLISGKKTYEGSCETLLSDDRLKSVYFGDP